jgi:hypothetical protein
VIGIVTLLHERFVKQLDGSKLGGLNCTMAAGASFAYRHTLGRVVTSGAALRRLSGDTSGGTTLDQLAYALKRRGVSGFYGPYRGMPIRSFYGMLRAGHGAVVQGASKATKGTRWQASEYFEGNHAWYVSRGRDWFTPTGRGYPIPKAVRVFDPLADRRRKGIAKAPFWLPTYYFERFLALLDLGGYKLGQGKVYALITRNTNPHLHGVGQLNRVRFRVKPGYNVRETPGGKVVRRTRDGEVFDSWARITNGPAKGGSRVWYRDHSGRRWVHESARKKEAPAQ